MVCGYEVWDAFEPELRVDVGHVYFLAVFGGAGFEVEEGGLRDCGGVGGGGGFGGLRGFDGEFGGAGAGGDDEVLEGEDEIFFVVVVVVIVFVVRVVVVVGVGVGARRWSGFFRGRFGDVAVAFEAEEMG